MKNFLCACLLPAAVLLAGAFTGCTSAATAAKAKADKEEYVTVMTTGSNIPVRLRKSDLEKGQLAKGKLADSVDKEEFQRNLRPGRKIDTGSN